MNCILTINGRGYTAERGSLLIDAASDAGFVLCRGCGGKGICGKCSVLCYGRLHDGISDDGGERYRLACHTVIDGDCSVYITKDALTAIALPTQKDIKPSGDVGIGCAADIGTTTVVVSKYDLKSGKYISSTALENPQRRYGADVISRIEYGIKNGVEPLKDALMQAICKETADAQKVIYTGNTTMLLIASGINPAPLGASPYTSPTLFDSETDGVYYPPCIHSFAGADLVTAILASGMTSKTNTALLCDIGTNGETALWHGGRLYVCSAAAGPCFEGYGIKNGTPAIDGAINAVGEDGMVYTVGGKPAKGFCGSGLIDAAAYLLSKGAIKQDGSMNGSQYFDGVELCEGDVREFQLAKSAIATGIALLLKHSGVAVQDIDTLYLAGGLGSAVNPCSAARTGLIPSELQAKTVQLGNAAAYGAAMMLTDEAAKAEARRIVSLSRYVDLAADDDFTDVFTDNLLF